MAPTREPPPRHDMVPWLSPRTLLSSAREVAVSAMFARFADKREIEGGLSAETFDCRPPAGEPAWLEHASDVGEGFASTYSVARLLAAPELSVGEERTRRGPVLVRGRSPSPLGSDTPIVLDPDPLASNGASLACRRGELLLLTWRRTLSCLIRA